MNPSTAIVVPLPLTREAKGRARRFATFDKGGKGTNQKINGVQSLIFVLGGVCPHQFYWENGEAYLPARAYAPLTREANERLPQSNLSAAQSQRGGV